MPNIDIVTGEWAMRVERKSGVDLSAAPFSIADMGCRVLSEVPASSRDVVYRTTAHAF